MNGARGVGVALAGLFLLASRSFAASAPASPDPVPEASAARGKQVFEHRCAMCHREGGTGTFVLARRLGKDLSLLERRTDLNPDYVRHVVRWGYVNMPRISRVELPDRDLEAIIAYLGRAQP